MELYRKLNSYIEEYYGTQKSALLLTGARQTGKTYAIRKFGERFDDFLEINFLEHPEYVNLFKDGVSAEELLLRISAIGQRPLKKGSTLIFFDEIQECPDILTSIKFLVDEGRYRYALSGSLLGVELKGIRSVPVGYLGIKEVFPLDLEEFMTNLGVNETVFEHVKQRWEEVKPVDEIVHNQLLSLYRLYTLVGGMPAAIAKYVETKDLSIVEQTQRDIVDLYRQDIAKYASEDSRLKIKEIFDLVPSELNSKNKRFILKRLNEHAKYERYANDFLWLKNAGVVIPVYNVEEPCQPLKLAETRNLFKLFSNDVGLLTAQYAEGIQLKILSGEVDINFGAIYENAVAQELLCHSINPYYYNSKKFGEVDFVISVENRVIPIEVKSGKDYYRHNALRNLLANEAYGIEKAYVLCNGNMEREDKIIYAPIYMTMFIRRPEIGRLIYEPDISALI